MAHEIENNQIAWKGQQPWHGLGFEVPANATGAEMLKIAGLDWLVESVPMAMQGVGATGAYNVTAGLDRFRIIRRADNLYPFQTASGLWKAVQNSEVVDFFREYCEAGNATMETVGALRGGAVVWALARLQGRKGDAVITPKASAKGAKGSAQDDVRGYMLLATSHDGSIPTTGFPTQVRVVCGNTFRMAVNSNERGDKSATFRMLHFQKFDGKRKDEARSIMGMAVEEVQATNEIANQLAKVSIDADARLEFLERILLKDGSVLNAIVDAQQPSGSILDAAIANTQGMTREAREDRLGKVGKAVLEAIIDSPGSDMASAKNTLWGAFNGVTYYADHVAREFQAGNRLYKSWFGDGQAMKTKALNAAIEMAGIQTAAARN